MEKIVILTGAGISAESGLGTFRDEGGLWAQHRIEDVATPEGFARDPALVHSFYNARREQAGKATPNAAHHAIADLQKKHKGEVVLVTQNVDSLHEAAGSPDVIHMHGQLDRAKCAACNAVWPSDPMMYPSTLCPECKTPAARPDVVWFGEMPYAMDAIFDHLGTADLFVAIGTSGNVYPAAGFVQEASAHGAQTLEINLEPSSVVSSFDDTRFGTASTTVPQWVADVLAS